MSPLIDLLCVASPFALWFSIMAGARRVAREEIEKVLADHDATKVSP